MPELPEVETTRRGVSPHVIGRRVVTVNVREHRLRWPVPADLAQRMTGETVTAVDRRAKYLLFRTGRGSMMLHLGMSGSLRVLNAASEPGPHDHVDLILDHGHLLRYRDPRRFGSIHWLDGDEDHHALLDQLGPEPLSDVFTGDLLFQLSRGRKAPVKNFIMDSHVVVGVGNIYANEALFLAGIHPQRAAGKISAARYQRLAQTIRQVLEQAIAKGGTTLRDFVNESGSPGYFRHELKVYGRGGEACEGCGTALKEIRLGQRTTVYCGRCQR